MGGGGTPYRELHREVLPKNWGMSYLTRVSSFLEDSQHTPLNEIDG